MGEKFSAAAVADAAALSLNTVEERCAQLARQGRFVRLRGQSEWPDGTVAARYGFIHALYREILYARLTIGRLKVLHGSIGARLEQAYSSQTEEIAATLAVHFIAAQDPEKAVSYLGQAADNAMQRHVNYEAVGHLTKALELRKTFPDSSMRDQQEFMFLVTHGAALMISRGNAATEVEETFLRARELAEQLGGPVLLVPIVQVLWSVHFVRGQHQRAREVAEEGLRFAMGLFV